MGYHAPVCFPHQDTMYMTGRGRRIPVTPTVNLVTSSAFPNDYFDIFEVRIKVQTRAREREQSRGLGTLVKMQEKHYRTTEPQTVMGVFVITI